MKPNAAELPQDSSSPVTMTGFVVNSMPTGTVTIVNTDGILSLTGSGVGWVALGNVITFEPEDGVLHVLTLQAPQDWSWNPSAFLEVFHGEANLCGFYSTEAKLQVFNGTNKLAPHVLGVIFNLEDENNEPAPFPVLLHFPTSPSSSEEEEISAQARPIPTPIQDQIIHCSPSLNSHQEVDHLDLANSGRGWSTSNTLEGGEIRMRPVSDSEGTTTTWKLHLHFGMSEWQLAGEASFQVYFEFEHQCGVVFQGPEIKAYNYLPPGAAHKTFMLGLKLMNVNTGAIKWLDDPTIVFDPLDPPT